jgi:hypothetical protein
MASVTLDTHGQKMENLIDEKGSNITVAEIEDTKVTKDLVISPYTDPAHLLDLSTLDLHNQLLARALTIMRPLREDYATAPYVETFNWSEIISELQNLAVKENVKWKETLFYIVVFRSRIPPTTIYAELGALDKVAHAEAVASGGFLKYVHPDSHGNSDSHIGIGLDTLMLREETWPLVCGEIVKMPFSEGLVLVTREQLRQQDRSIQSGTLNDCV